MTASASPNAPTSASSRADRPDSRGRHRASRITAANTNRSHTVPPGPSWSNSVAASAAPNWTDVAAPRTSQIALGFNGTLSRFGGASTPPLPPPRMRPDLANVALVAATGPDAANFRVRGTLLAPALREYGVALDPLPLFDAQHDVLFHSADPRRRAR